MIRVLLIGRLRLVEKGQDDCKNSEADDDGRGGGGQGAPDQAEDQIDYAGEGGGAENQGERQQNAGEGCVLTFGCGAGRLPLGQVRLQVPKPLLTVGVGFPGTKRRRPVLLPGAEVFSITKIRIYFINLPSDCYSSSLSKSIHRAGRTPSVLLFTLYPLLNGPEESAAKLEYIPGVLNQYAQ